MPSYTARRRVEFHDTDAAGIAHFSAFFTYMEEAEHEFLRNLGLSVMLEREGERLSWPRVAAACDFEGSVRFEDELDIDVSIERIGEKSVRYGFRFSHAGRPIADGTMTSVCCRIEENQPPQPVPIPDWFREKLQRA